ncbi:hypothetical protein [Nitrobacter sp.]|jgi:phosphate/sulfate permease|uniref:hypothetical protein n=1 Tax=Nitrobacter sp. TaxID=29420 RepID=UPI003F64D3AC
MKTRVARSGWQALAVFVIFLIAGPPIGALTSLLMAAIFNPTGLFGGAGIEAVIQGTPFVMFFSYLFGGIQAAVVGMIAAVSRYYSHRQVVPLSAVLGGCLFVSFALSVLVWAHDRTAHPKMSTPIFSVFWVMLLVNLGAGIGCWFLSNRLVRATCADAERAA